MRVRPGLGLLIQQPVAFNLPSTAVFHLLCIVTEIMHYRKANLFFLFCFVFLISNCMS